MSDLIERQAAIDALRTCQTYLFHTYDPDKKISLESAEFEIEQLPSVQPDRKTSEWLHEYLQTAVDFGIITETQASRLMDMIAEDNT